MPPFKSGIPRLESMKVSVTVIFWRFLALTLTALTMGLTFAHALEALPKLRWNGKLYLSVQTNLYYLFGNVGAATEVGAVVAAFVLTALVRGRGRVFGWTLAGALILLSSLVVWFLFVAPVNAQTSAWQQAGAVPTNWQAWRNQWEAAQAACFVLHLFGFGALLRSVLLETPS